jgi:hypothetical protein
MAVGQGSGEPMPHSEGGWLRHIYTGQQGELGATAECPVEAEDHAGGDEQHGSQRLIPSFEDKETIMEATFKRQTHQRVYHSCCITTSIHANTHIFAY